MPTTRKHKAIVPHGVPACAMSRRKGRTWPLKVLGWAAVAVILASVEAAAQTPTVSAGTAKGNAGTTVDLSVNFTAGSTAVSSLQFDLMFPSALSYVSSSTGPAAAAAGKNVAGGAIAGGVRVIIFGFNQTPIGSGVVTTVQLAIAAGTKPGIVSVTVGGLSASDPSGALVSLSGSGGSVTVLDSTPPKAAFTAPTSGAAYPTSTTPLNIAGTASDNVGVTKVIWANDRGGTGTASGTASWSASGIALQTGSNLITVTATDAAGNTGTAALTVTFTSDSTPPVISSISAKVRATSAVVSWTTNEPADSQVSFGRSTAYGQSTALDSTLVTSHSQTLTGLTARTGYHFKVKSRDAAGNQSLSQDCAFTTSNSDSSVKVFYYFPGSSTGSRKRHAAQIGGDDYVSIALTNLDTTDATLTFRAYNASGTLVSGVNVANPVTRTLKPGAQMPVIDVQLFGAGIAATGPVGWIQVESSTSKLTGFFMAFDSRLSMLDGAEVTANLLNSSVLPETGSDDFTEIQLSNPNAEAASVRVDLMRADGTVRASAGQVIQPQGTYSADVYGDVFSGIARDPSDYLKVVSTQGLLSYEIVRKAAGDIALLAGQDSSAGSSQLYSPQYVVGGTWRSTLSIVNLDSVPGVLMLKLIGDDGSQIGPAQFVNIAAGGKAYISDQAFFGAFSPEQPVQGYVEVTGLGLRLAGNVMFSDATRGRFTSTLPLVSVLGKSAIFSHVASNSTYFTGLAILNPNQTPAFATIDLYGSDGMLAASTTVMIPARQRKSALLSEYFPGLVGQDWTSGYFRLTADNWVASFALFGTNDLGVLSAIPGQPVP